MDISTKKNVHIRRTYKEYKKPVLTKKRNHAIMNKDIFSKIEIINELGAGMIGTTYLAKYKGKNYALKIQHILPEQKKKSFKSDLWREYDFYGYINTLSQAEQGFFTKLYHMQIYDNCTHIQKRPYPIPKAGAFAERMRKLDESTWCVKYLMDYHGIETLEKYIQTKTISNATIISFALQIINILLILYRGGYSHNDLHPGNIMVKPANTKTFKMQNIKGHTFFRGGLTLPNKELQIVAIDYGNVLHAKYHVEFTDKLQKLFMKDRQTYLFNEMFNALAKIIFYDKSIIEIGKKCSTQQIKYPWEYKGDTWSTGMKNIIINHSAFVTEKVGRYMAIFPVQSMHTSDELMEQLLRYLDNSSDKTYMPQFWNIMSRVHYEFMYHYPEEFAKYFARCAIVKIPYAESIVIGFLKCGTVPELVNLFVKLSLDK